MKIMFFGYGKEYRLFNRESGNLFERILFTVFILLFTMIIFSQVNLLGRGGGSLREITEEGAPLGREEYLYSGGTIELRLMSGERDDELKVLLNGEEAAVFSSRNVKLEVREGDVLELESERDTEDQVALCGIEGSISRDNIGQVFEAEKGITRLIQVKAADE